MPLINFLKTPPLDTLQTRTNPGKPRRMAALSVCGVTVLLLKKSRSSHRKRLEELLIVEGTHGRRPSNFVIYILSKLHTVLKLGL